jgi:Fur family iron response transcriptional regulator
LRLRPSGWRSPRCCSKNRNTFRPTRSSTSCAGGSRVSKATVYNTLHLFGARGLARELVVDPSRTFYDSTTHPHHHFYNVDSGQLSDIPGDDVRFLELPALPEGTEQESVEVLIKIRGRQR